MGFFDKLKQGMNKTKNSFDEKINNVFKSFKKVDEEFLDELEEICKNNFSNLVTVYAVKKDFLILELCEDCTKNSFLKSILDYGIDIESFSVYEPSLTDIFVLKAGDE